MESALYDFYGFRVYVEGLRLKKLMDKEYWRSKVSEQDEPFAVEADLYIKAAGPEGPTEFPTKPSGSKLGIYMPFNEDDKVLYYEPGVAVDYILPFLDNFLSWEDKTLIHTGAVSKNGKAYIFCAAGDVGKTSIVLNLVRKNYDYLSDDRLVIGNGQAYPFPITVHIFTYNLRDPQISKPVLGWKRYFYKPFFKFLDIAQKISPHRYLRYLFLVIISLMRFDVDVEDLGSDIRVGEVCPISKVFYLERWDGSELLVTDISVEELSRRMAMISMYESGFFLKEFYKYAAQYHITNKKLENRFEFNYGIYYDTFKNTEIHKLMIPRNLVLSSVEDLPIKLGIES